MDVASAGGGVRVGGKADVRNDHRDHPPPQRSHPALGGQDDERMARDQPPGGQPDQTAFRRELHRDVCALEGEPHVSRRTGRGDGAGGLVALSAGGQHAASGRPSRHKVLHPLRKLLAEKGQPRRTAGGACGGEGGLCARGAGGVLHLDAHLPPEHSHRALRDPRQHLQGEPQHHPRPRRHARAHRRRAQAPESDAAGELGDLRADGGRARGAGVRDGGEGAAGQLAADAVLLQDLRRHLRRAAAR
mmetsp:Transcript_20066/g.43922  ORF Transcript_20066/g.43922 Transcript_20066/m.43922 type:complete len:246 (+) Transcript_20066:1645-2382(+)